MRKFLVKIILLSIIILCFLQVDSLANVTTEKITNFNMVMEVKEDSSIEATEIFAINIGNSGQYDLKRYFPVEYNGRKIEIEILEVLDNENKIDFDVAKINRNFILKLNSNGRMVDAGVHLYVIKYKVKNAISFGKEDNKLEYRIFGDSWILPIDGYSIRINFPEGTAFLQDSFKVYSEVNGAKLERESINKKMDDKSLIVSGSEVVYPGADLIISTKIATGTIKEITFKDKISKFVSDNLVSFVILIGGIIMFIWHLTELQKKKDRVGLDVTEHSKGKLKMLFSLSGMILSVLVGMLIGMKENYLCIMNYVLNVLIKFYILALVELLLVVILFFIIRYEMYKKGIANKILGLFTCFPVSYIAAIIFLNYCSDIYYNLFAYMTLLIVFIENLYFSIKIKGKKVFEMFVDEENTKISTVERQ